MYATSAALTASRTGAEALFNPGIEAGRIGFLLARDGRIAAIEWVKRTVAIYEQAVADSRHFASTPGYRDGFLASCTDFHRWLQSQEARSED